MEKWIVNQISGEDMELKEIKKLLTNLVKSPIPRSKLFRMEMILDDISRNRNRVERIIYQLHPVFTNGNSKEGDRMKALKRLLSYKLISREQYNNLEKKLGDLDMETIIAEIKETKIGRGLDFLPTTIRKLKEAAKDWIMQYAEKKSKLLRDKLLAVLDELLQRRVLSKHEHRETLAENELD